jgi:hypothetical protein
MEKEKKGRTRTRGGVGENSIDSMGLEEAYGEGNS